MVEALVLAVKTENTPTVFLYPKGSGNVISVAVSSEEAACIGFELAHLESSEVERNDDQPAFGYGQLTGEFVFQLVRQMQGRFASINLQRNFMGDTANVHVHGVRGKYFATCSAGLGIVLALRSRTLLYLWEGYETDCEPFDPFLKGLPDAQALAVTERIAAESRKIRLPVVRISLTRTSPDDPQKKAAHASPKPVAKSREDVAAEEQERWLSMLNTLTPENKEPM